MKWKSEEGWVESARVKNITRLDPNFSRFFTPLLLSRRLLSRFVLITKRLEQAGIKANKKHMIDVISSSFAISGSVRNLSWHWFTIILYSLQLTQFPLNFYLSLSLSLSLSPSFPPPPAPPLSLSSDIAFFIEECILSYGFYSLVTRKKDPAKWFHRPV